jgi:ubiquinone/menaquinone biosynthesis C-methylase UbiE
LKHLVRIDLLIIFIGLAACAQLRYEHMNDPARGLWQQPAAVIEALNVKEGNTVADLGAGSGYFTFRFSNAVGQAGTVYAVDVDPASLAFIERQGKERGGIANVEMVLAAPDDPKLPANSVDLLFMSNTYRHLTQRVTYFTALSRVLRPGGRVAIIDYKDEGLRASLFGHATSKESVRRELEAAGYRLIHDFDFLPKQHFQVFVRGST